MKNAINLEQFFGEQQQGIRKIKSIVSVCGYNNSKCLLIKQCEKIFLCFFFRYSAEKLVKKCVAFNMSLSPLSSHSTERTQRGR